MKDRVEGYWWSKDREDRQYPKPEPRDKPWKGKGEFIKHLMAIERRAPMRHYKGVSFCRICNARNGSTEYTKAGWAWPLGFLHYVEAHNVKPSDDFIAFIMSGGEIKAKKPRLTKQERETRKLDTVISAFYQAQRDGKITGWRMRAAIAVARHVHNKRMRR